MAKVNNIIVEMLTAARLKSSLEKKQLSNQRLSTAAAKKEQPKPVQSPPKKK